MTENKTKARDLAPTAVRISPELRHMLMREATINGRSLHAEILLRLKESLLPGAAARRHGLDEPSPSYVAEMTDAERRALTLFKKLSPEKQLALLSLLS